jgi:5'-3' exonuclease
VFDHDNNSNKNAEFHNPKKLLELAKRKKRKDVAKQKLADLSMQTTQTTQSTQTTQTTQDDTKDVLFSDMLFSDDDEDLQSSQPTDTQPTTQITDAQSTEDKKSSLEKQMFSVNSEMINDIKLILNLLNIKYVEAPAGFEGEAIAAYLSATDQVDGVYSADTDPIAFGAKVLYRKNPRDKKIYEYTQDDILDQIKNANEEFADPNLNDIRTACIALGWDANEKTARIGAKTVLKKLHQIKLTDKQKEIKEHLEQVPNNSLHINNIDKVAFVDCSHTVLINWLVAEKSFSESRVLSWLKKVMTI